MTIPKSIKVLWLGVLVAIGSFLLIDTYPIFYFDSITYKGNDVQIEFHYKWSLIAYREISIDRAIKIKDKSGHKVSFKLPTSPQGPTEIQVHRIDQAFTYKDRLIKKALYFHGIWAVALVDMENYELIEADYIDSFMGEPLDSTVIKHCIGKFHHDQFVKDNCEMDFLK